MKPQRICLFLLLFVVLSLPHISSQAAFPDAGWEDNDSLDVLGNLPVYFEANVGQFDNPQAEFVAQGAGYSLFLSQENAVFALRDESSADGETAVVQIDEQQYRLPLRSIDRARAMPRLEFGQNKQ